jgi:trk system potassium uptake protein TrkA
VISAGSELSLLLAQTLEKSDMRVVLLESNAERARQCAESLKQALVLRGMSLDQKALEEAGVRSRTTFVAASESDGNNMISCIMATKLGADYTLALAQIRNPDYMSVITSLGVLDRAVLPQHSLISAILQFVRGKHVRPAAGFHDMPGELIELEIVPGDEYSHQKLSGLRIRRHSILVGVMRESRVKIPTGELVLLPGDRVVLFSMK